MSESLRFRALNVTRNSIVAEHLDDSGGAAGRARGLMGRDSMEPGCGMLFRAGIIPLMWMHMLFMRFPIDIVFLDGDGSVLKIDHGLRPWRLSSVVFGARTALELGAGAARASKTEPGDRIVLEVTG